LSAAARSGKDQAQLLMRKAAGDEAILARLIEDADIPDEALGFHAQQAVVRYDDLPGPALDRQEALSVVQSVKAWADGELVEPGTRDTGSKS
jgi:hypothetical protein